MIPTPKNWKVTFILNDGTVLFTVVNCVKRFAVMLANEQLGYPRFHSKKVSVGLVRA